ncbi:hypothetical protein [Paraburkholderia saeva]|uniref:hypothetical protein n=1 Tax=Paraburkholderia saeva TaxID=2777537 RepID=UPI001D403462|nr:hypothetical protein [Paraburkholderia saeva]CAG4892214.1 hypothetical protein R52603_01368 [Paraburkholderia saeva]CAG4895099.1 hypothetical protein R70241_01907 [Paraburkholderia saeva]
MGLLSWLFPGNRAPDGADARQMKEIVERIVRLNPQLRLVRECDARVAAAARRAIDYLERLVAEMPAACEASADTWATDPHIHAFFAGPDDVCEAFSRSDELRTYFRDHPEADEVFAVLGMAIVEKRTFGVAQHGASVRSDVMQTTVSFSDHQVRGCSASEAALRREIVLRVVDQLALEGIARIEADESRRGALEQERALLRTRLALLERQGAGMHALVGSEASCSPVDVARLQAQIDENDRALASLGLKTEALERELDVICEELSSPDAHFYVTKKTFRLDLLNVVVEEDDTRPAENITFRIARLPARPDAMRAYAMVRFRRSNLLPARNTLPEAGRFLI